MPEATEWSAGIPLDKTQSRVIRDFPAVASTETESGMVQNIGEGDIVGREKGRATRLDKWRHEILAGYWVKYWANIGKSLFSERRSATTLAYPARSGPLLPASAPCPPRPCAGRAVGERRAVSPQQSWRVQRPLRAPRVFRGTGTDEKHCDAPARTNGRITERLPRPPRRSSRLGSRGGRPFYERVNGSGSAGGANGDGGEVLRGQCTSGAAWPVLVVVMCARGGGAGEEDKEACAVCQRGRGGRGGEGGGCSVRESGVRRGAPRIRIRKLDGERRQLHRTRRRGVSPVLLLFFSYTKTHPLHLRRRLRLHLPLPLSRRQHLPALARRRRQRAAQRAPQRQRQARRRTRLDNSPMSISSSRPGAARAARGGVREGEGCDTDDGVALRSVIGFARGVLDDAEALGAADEV
ncbi:hypothetical protein B0H14DRAFT_3170347 [Mycena olivaceomarginata]|nr:hypothetical protein B0H14DRAFT_3170347 [Mycena olivaceomarginata]